MAKVFPFNVTSSENLSYPVGDYRIFRITPIDQESMAYLPKLVIRALEFLDKYHAETDPVWLTQLLYNNLQNPQAAHLVFALVALNPDNQIAAHSISYADTFQRLGTVAIHLQMELKRDPPIPLEDKNKIRQLGRELQEEWVRSLKLKTILAYTTDASVARLHRRDGYMPFRVMVRKNLEG